MSERRKVRLGRHQQVIIVLGVWMFAVISSGEGIEAATPPLTLLCVLAAAVLVGPTVLSFLRDRSTTSPEDGRLISRTPSRVGDRGGSA